MYLKALLFLVLSFGIPLTASAADEEAGETQEEYVGYVELKPFVANYGETTELHFLKCEITIQAGSAEAEQAIGDHLDAIRNDILYLLMAQSEESLNSVSAQKILAKKAILLVQQRLAEEEDNEEAAKVSDLFFVSFVAQ